MKESENFPLLSSKSDIIPVNNSREVIFIFISLCLMLLTFDLKTYVLKKKIKNDDKDMEKLSDN